MFCRECGSPCASDDKFCLSCGAVLIPPDPPATTSKSKLVPLSRYPFLRHWQGETEHAIRYCGAVVEIELAGPIRRSAFIVRVRGLYEPPKLVTYKVAVVLVTNKRLLFLQDDTHLLFWSVMLKSQQVRLHNESEAKWRRHHPESPGDNTRLLLPKENVQMYLSPFWVLDASLNDELDKEFKDCVWPRISNLDNLSTLYQQAEESPYKFNEAWSEWTWARSCREGEKRRILRPPRLFLQFELECVHAMPPQQSVVEQVGEDAPKYAKRIARFFDKLETGRDISYGLPAGIARLYLENPDELAELSTMLNAVPKSDMAFTEQYRDTLRAAAASFAAKVNASGRQNIPSQTTGSAATLRSSVTKTFFNVYSVMVKEWFRSLAKVVKLLILPIVVLAAVGLIISTSDVIRKDFPSVPSFVSFGVPTFVAVLAWFLFRKLGSFWRLVATLLVLVALNVSSLSVFDRLKHFPSRSDHMQDSHSTPQPQVASPQPTGTPSPNSRPTVVRAIIESGGTSLRLPAGNLYMYAMVTGGARPSTPFSSGQFAQVNNAAGQLAGALAYGTNSQNDYTSQAGARVIGGVSVAGAWDSLATHYGSNSTSGASTASVSFDVSENSFVVVIALSASEKYVSVRGISTLQTDASSNGGELPMLIAHAYIPSGNYTLTETSSAVSGQEPIHMADLIGVFVFGSNR